MLRPARMVQLNVLVLDSDVDRTTAEMIRGGLVHIVSVTDMEPWAQEQGLQAEPDERSKVLAQLENMARAVTEMLGVSPQTVSEALAFEQFRPDDARQKLEEITREAKSAVAARHLARQNLTALQQTRRQLPLDAWAKFGVDLRSGYTLLEVVTGRLQEKNLDTLKRLLSEVPNVVLTFPEEKGTVTVMVIVLKRNRDTLRKAMEETGLEQLPVRETKEPVSDEMMAQLDQHISDAEQEIKKAESAVDKCRAAHLPALRAILSQVGLQKLMCQAKSRFRKTARTYLISGWTPRSSRERVVDTLRKACSNRCLIEEQNAEEILSERGGKVDVPVLFENPKFLKPFEMLVSGYGRPTYNSVDPTIVVAPTFLLMYGAMFGDVGQGLVMAILGALVARSKKVSEGIRRIAQLFIWCGSSAALFGLLYGSIFGPTELAKELLPWGFELLEKVDTFLTLAIFFGIAMISLGIGFNVIAAIGKREWVAGILDWSGLIGLAFYWLAVPTVIKVFSGGQADRTLIAALFALPVLAAVVRGPVDKFTRKAARGPEPGSAASILSSFGHMLGTFFEAVLTFFVNTLSFLRVAVFAVAHAALFTAVFSLAEVLQGVAGLPVAVHILGNAGMIALEGLVVCVQALRLEYYEFFGKFFQVGGTEFTPMKLPGTVP